MLTIFCPGLLLYIHLALENLNDGQRELLCELPVPVIVGRYCHDGTGTVADEYVVGDPDGDLLSVYRVDGIGTGEDTCLVLCEVCSFKIGLVFCGIEICFNCFFLLGSRELFNKRMLRCDYHVCCAEERVTACCVNFKLLIELLKLEEYCGTLTSSDPVALHCLDAFRPV